MIKTFNLRKHIKKAFYEDGRGYWNTQTRSWMNCYKCQSDSGKGPQEAWNNCLEEYQNHEDKGKWVMNYSSVDTGQKRFDAKTPAAKK